MEETIITAMQEQVQGELGFNVNDRILQAYFAVKLGASNAESLVFDSIEWCSVEPSSYVLETNKEKDGEITLLSEVSVKSSEVENNLMDLLRG